MSTWSRGAGRAGSGAALAALLAGTAAAGPPSGAELAAAAVQAMGGAAAIAALDGLQVTAECSGPGGAFESAVHWRRGGPTLLRQTDADGRRDLLAIGDRAWRIEPGTGRARAELPAESAAMVHGHAFHPTLFELDRRFHGHRAAGRGPDGCLLMEMLDEHERPASVCLDPRTMLPARFSFTPPGPGGAIQMELAGWRRHGELLYFDSFRLRQGGQEYRWVYSTIRPDPVRPDATSAAGAWGPGERISLSLREADLAEVLRSFARMAGFDLVLDPAVRGAVTVELTDVPWEQALQVILETHGLGIEDDGSRWRVRR